MPDTPDRPRLLTRRRLFTVVTLTLVIVAITLLGARFWLTTESGRTFIMSEISGQQAGSLGTIGIKGLTGDPFGTASVESITLSDPDGIWLEADTVILDWSPASLLGRTVRINAVTAKRLKIHRRPVSAPRDSSREGGNWRIQLRSATIDVLDIAEGVAGPEAAFKITARYDQRPSGALEAALQALPLAGRGDRAKFTLSRSASDRFDLQFDAEGPQGGTFGHLLGVPDDSSVLLIGSAAGTLSEARGEARLAIADTNAVFLALAIERQQLTATLRADASQLPLDSHLTRFIGNEAEVDLTADLAPRLPEFMMEARLAAGLIRLSGQAHENLRSLPEPVHLYADLETLAPFTDIGAGAVVDGLASLAGGRPGFEGEVRLVAHDESTLPFDGISGPLRISSTDRLTQFEAELTGHGVFRHGGSLGARLVMDPVINAAGDYDPRVGLVRLSRVALTTADGEAFGAFSYGLETGRIEAAGNLRLPLSPFSQDITGTAEGLFNAEGRISDLTITANLRLRELAGLPMTLSDLTGQQGEITMRAMLRDGVLIAQPVRARFAGIDATATGRLAGPAGPDLRFEARQITPIQTDDMSVTLGALRGRMSSINGGLRIQADTEGGWLEAAGQRIDALAAAADIRIEDERVSGPVTLTGTLDGTVANVSLDLLREGGVTQFANVRSVLGPLRITGNGEAADDGAFALRLEGQGRDVILPAGEFRALSVNAIIDRPTGQPFVITSRLGADGVRLTSGIHLDRILAEVATDADGYRYSAGILDSAPGHETDLRITGRARTTENGVSGSLNATGQVLGHPVRTTRPASWSLGDTPVFDLAIDLLSGQLEARLEAARGEPRLEYAFSGLDARPLLEAMGRPALNLIFSGNGDLRPYGLSPSGDFLISASTPVPGLDTEIMVEFTGQLSADAALMEAIATYGNDLRLTADARLPVTAQEAGFVTFDSERALTGGARLSGDLDGLRTLALAYGHDIGGIVDAQAVISGTLSAPQTRIAGTVRQGLYEFGRAGFQLTEVNFDTRWEEDALQIDGTASGPGGGTLRAEGRAGLDGGQVNLTLSRLLVFNRLGDSARISGNAQLQELQDRRLVTGNITIDEARLSLENLPASRTRRLNVRWDDAEADTRRSNLLEKPVTLDVGITAPRRIFVTGRGLDTDWGVRMRVRGNPADPHFNGQAVLVRGELGLAGRPFIFDSGRISLDGPLASAQLNLSAERDSGGFRTRVEVTGSAAQPAFVLSSTPELPQDEVLARLLFGRSALDLTPIEAAQLASAIATLSGQGDSLNPLGQIQAGLGVDRLLFGVDDEGRAELGIGQYLTRDVYVEVRSAGEAGNAIGVEWQPREQVAVTSETRSTGEGRVSIRWKHDY